MTVTQEPEGVSTRSVGAVGAVSVAIAVASAFGAFALLQGYTQGQGVVLGSPRPPAPSAEPAHIERGLLRTAGGPSPETKRGEARLRSAGYVDRSARIAHLPIERAIELYVSLAQAREPLARRPPAGAP